MSLYKEFEQTANVYHLDDSNATKKGSYPATADFTIDLFIQQRNEDTTVLLGDEIGDYIVNVNAEYDNAENIRKADKIIWDSETYIVKNKPKYLNLFNKYKITLSKGD